MFDRQGWHAKPGCGSTQRSAAWMAGPVNPLRTLHFCSAVQPTVYPRMFLEPHIIGNEEIIYRSMVVGGSTNDAENRAVYRWDSFICASAIHAGVISNAQGGCGILSRQGSNRQFLGSTRNGISSVEFLPNFPLSFSIGRADVVCSDPQWYLFTVSVVISILLSLIISSPSVFFASSVSITFFQTAIASNPPFSPDFASLLSIALERFLLTAFVLQVLYRAYIRHTLHGLSVPLERAVLWLGGCWVGALNNYTFDKIPISRPTSHDLLQQPGAITALLIILSVIAISAVHQARLLKAEGRLLNYIILYLVFGSSLAILAAIPGLQLRLHHYIIALSLIPGTAIQSRSSLLYQGTLVGLFLNGVARWGYASILQTADALREDGLLGSAIPQIVHPNIGLQTVTFAMPVLAPGFDGISIVVHDVECFRASGSSLSELFSWTRIYPDDPAFFRFAFTGTKPLGGIWQGDYSKPGVWYPNGTWDHPNP